jgi:hypothetical protein
MDVDAGEIGWVQSAHNIPCTEVVVSGFLRHDGIIQANHLRLGEAGHVRCAAGSTISLGVFLE